MKLGFLFIASAIAVAQAQQAPAQPPAPDPTQAGSFRGRVTDSITGEPLARVSLVLQLLGSSRSYSGSTGTDGQFELKTIQPGRYLLTGKRDGYPTQMFPKNGNYGHQAVLTIASGKGESGLDFHLVRQSAIGGRIFDDKGEPLGGVQVRVFQKSYANGWPATLSPGRATTNGNVDLWIGDLRPGRYYIEAQRHSSVLAKPTDGAIEEGTAILYFSGASDLASASPLDLKPGEQNDRTPDVATESASISSWGHCCLLSGPRGSVSKSNSCRAARRMTNFRHIRVERASSRHPVSRQVVLLASRSKSWAYLCSDANGRS